MTKKERLIAKLKIEIFDILERQEILNREYREIEQLKQKKLEELRKVRGTMSDT